MTESDDSSEDGGFNFFGNTAGLADSSDSDSDSSGSDGEGGLTSSKKRAKLDKGGGGKGGKKHALPSSSALFNDASAGGAAFLDAGAGIYATDEVDAFDNRKAAVERKPWLSKKQTVAVTIEGTRSGDGEVANPDAVSYANQLLNGTVGSGGATGGGGQATGLAAELNAAAMSASNTYGNGERGAYEKEAVPISEMHVKKGKELAKGFNAKEKRKRDEGMSARGKSNVEEEKRLLRQNGTSSYD
eukprot:gene4047-6970_t